jgi:hypothetical protein
MGIIEDRGNQPRSLKPQVSPLRCTLVPRQAGTGEMTKLLICERIAYFAYGQDSYSAGS